MDALKIKNKRKALGLTQKDLAIKLGFCLMALQFSKLIDRFVGVLISRFRPSCNLI